MPIVPANRTEEQKLYGNDSDSVKFGGLVISSGAREFPFPKSFLLKSPPPPILSEIKSGSDEFTAWGVTQWQETISEQFHFHTII